MSKRNKYQRYGASVKAAIAASGRSDLFPDLKIPRMTARYWIDQGFEVTDPVISHLTAAISDSKLECDNLKQTLIEKEAIIKLLHFVFKTMGFELRWKKIESPDTKAKILDAVAWAMETVSRNEILEQLGMSLSRYKRWRRERRGCGTGLKTCPRIIANQLTMAEIQTMRNLVTSKEFAHFPIRSLHYYAKREGLLYCSYSTWRKYIDQFKWKRLRKEYPEKKLKIGIRAKHPNEIWHLDVSVFVLPNNKKGFIQSIIDNYSRYVVAWQVLEAYDGSKTADLLKKALCTVAKIQSKETDLRLIVDGGGENRSNAVKKLETLGYFRKEVARFELSSSNAMVEVLFRSLKNNYLYHQAIPNFATLRRHVNFWFPEHNEKIPHSSFNGETPRERFEQTWNRDCEIRILVRHEEAVRLRIKENQRVFCEQCEVA